MEILVFEIERERYGLVLLAVQEVFRAVAITRLPKAPSVVEGVINLRGKVIPVFDLRRRFGLRGKAVEPSEKLVIAEAGNRTVALRVERILQITRVNAADMEDAKSILPRAEYVSGVARLPGGLVLIHDLHTFLSQAESEVLDEALADADLEEDPV